MATAIGSERPSRYPITHLGRNIKILQRQRRLKQTALAQLAGVSPNTISCMIRNKPVSPTLRSVELVAKALGVPLWRLLKPPEDWNDL